MKFIKQLKTVSLLNAILLLIAGILCCFWPNEANSIIVTVVCILVILSGVVNMVEFVIEEKYYIFNKGSLILSILKILLGVYLFSNKAIVSTFLGIIFGIYIIVEGCNSFEEGTRLCRYKASGSILCIIMSIFITIFGVMLLFDPIEASSTMTLYIGVSLIADSINRFITLYTIQRASKEIKSAFYGIDQDVIDVDYKKL